MSMHSCYSMVPVLQYRYGSTRVQYRYSNTRVWHWLRLWLWLCPWRWHWHWNAKRHSRWYKGTHPHCVLSLALGGSLTGMKSYNSLLWHSRRLLLPFGDTDSITLAKAASNDSDTRLADTSLFADALASSSFCNNFYCTDTLVESSRTDFLGTHHKQIV